MTNQNAFSESKTAPTLADQLIGLVHRVNSNILKFGPELWECLSDFNTIFEVAFDQHPAAFEVTTPQDNVAVFARNASLRVQIAKATKASFVAFTE